MIKDNNDNPKKVPDSNGGTGDTVKEKSEGPSDNDAAKEIPSIH
jgi:hypothetical protein